MGRGWWKIITLVLIPTTKRNMTETHSHARLQGYFNFRKVNCINQVVSVVTIHLAYSLILLRLALRVSRTT